MHYRIHSREAEDKLEKAERCAMEAFEAARAMGVMMYDRPGDSPRRSYEIESYSSIGGRSTHTVTASFETAFEVDREVMAAVKKAFVQLAKSPTSSNKEEFKDLLWKISQNPDNDYSDAESSVNDESDAEPSGISSESEFDSECKGTDGVNLQGTQKKQKLTCSQLPLDDDDKSSTKSFTRLVAAMLDRLKSLQEDELASLATIVATCGLNAALLELGHSKDHELATIGDTLVSDIRQRTGGSRRNSSAAHFTDGYFNRKEPVIEVPSLDKFLVRHVSRLEREVQDAKDSRCQQIPREAEVVCAESKPTSLELVPDLGSILVKHVSRFEKEILEAKVSNKNNSVMGNKFEDSQGVCGNMQKIDAEVDRVVSSYQHKENINANTFVSSSVTPEEEGQARELKEISNTSPCGADVCLDQDNLKSSPVKHISRLERAKLEVLNSFSSQEQSSLDKILVKPVHRLQREKMQAVERGNEYAMRRDRQKPGTDATVPESLDKILVKHVSRLEKQRWESETNYGTVSAVKRRDQQLEKVESLDKILVKRQSMLEKAKLAAMQQPAYDIIKPRSHATEATSFDSLDKVLVRQQPEIGKAEMAAAQMAAAQQAEDYVRHADVRKKAREKELQEAWGGLSLGNSVRRHLSRLERETVSIIHKLSKLFILFDDG